MASSHSRASWAALLPPVTLAVIVLVPVTEYVAVFVWLYRFVNDISALLPAEEVAVTVAEPPAYPALVVVIVAVELVLAATPVTVTKPAPLTDTEPDAVAVPSHVYKAL